MRGYPEAVARREFGAGRQIGHTKGLLEYQVTANPDGDRAPWLLRVAHLEGEPLFQITQCAW
jgi:hypothetical protein